MIAFIKNYSLMTLKKKFILLYILNITDIIFTVLLLKTGYFEEVNVVMVKALQNPVFSILLKVILPAALLYFIYKRMKNEDETELKAANIAVNISITLYFLVNVSHVVWTTLLPFLITN